MLPRHLAEHLSDQSIQQRVCGQFWTNARPREIQQTGLQTADLLLCHQLGKLVNNGVQPGKSATDVVVDSTACHFLQSQLCHLQGCDPWKADVRVNQSASL